MFAALGVPERLEGFVGVQLFKAGRGYAEPVKAEAPAVGLDGAVLHLGELPDDYVQLRARSMAQLDALLSRFTADTTRFEDRLNAAIERERTEFQFDKRPMAILIVGARLRSADAHRSTDGTGSICVRNTSAG
jgi:hypothetical protein